MREGAVIRELVETNRRGKKGGCDEIQRGDCDEIRGGPTVLPDPQI